MVRKFKDTVLSNQQGFTLLELLAVMAIVVILAGVVTTSIGGTSEDSKDAQAMQDSTAVMGAAASYYSDQVGAEKNLTEKVAVLDVFPDVTQKISSRWPEDFVTSIYRDVFPPDNGTTVTEIVFLDEDGEILTVVVDKTNEAIDFAVDEILAGFTAIDFDILLNENYMSSEPDTVDQSSGLYANYLWLFEKADSAGSAGEQTSRNVALFKLIVVETIADGDDVYLVYQRLTR